MSELQTHRIASGNKSPQNSTGPTSSNLQEVTANGNTTDVGIYYPNVGANLGGNSGNTFTLDIGADFTIVSSAQGFALDFTTGVLNTVITQNATQQRTIELPDADGMVALTPVNVVSSDSNYVLGDSGYYTANGTTATTIIDPVTGNTGKRYILINMGTGDWTINASGGANEIFITNTLTNTFLLQPGESYIIYNNGLAWVILT